jgi:hypothetical protein
VVIRAAFGLFFGLVGGLLLWRVLYPEAGDPESIEYVMWRHGLNPNMDLDAVFRGMTSDSSRFELVSGLTKEQLTRKFGSLRDRNAWPGVGSCGSNAMIRSGATEAFGLRTSIWVVALKDGKAVALVICKG